MRYSRLLLGGLLAGAFSLIGTTAMAACSGTYCTQDHSGYSLSGYTGSSSSYSSGYSSGSYSLASSGTYAGSASDVPAGMCPTTCPVTVDAPAGSRVLACYKPCAQPAPQIVHTPVTVSYQVVRPIIMVPYAVPVAIPNRCGPIIDAPSRYGSRYGYSRCGY